MSFKHLLLLIGLWMTQTYAHDGAPQGKLPLGDGKISPTPKVGYVMACGMRFPGGGGAHRVGEWIKDGFWDPSAKPTVEGDVVWPNASLSIAVEGDWRVVRTNNLPNHRTGVYPVRPGSVAFEYDRNPNTIQERNVLFSLPALPAVAAQPFCVPLGPVGFALSGVGIFNAFDLQGRDAPAYEIQDKCNGHPERSGSYHYHDWSPCLAKDKNGRTYAANEPVGWMMDGFPILRPTDEQGRWFTNNDLDECHGRVGPVLLDGKEVQMYHYRFTREYPYTIGCYKGMPIPRRRL